MKNKRFFPKTIYLIILLVILAVSVFMYQSAKAASGPVSRYVATSGNDAGDCSSALAPCKTIQYAVNKSSSGDTILVAKGNYSYQSAYDVCPPWAHAVVCYVDKSLTILGGFTTNNWATANPSENLTVIDGQNTYRGVAVIGYKTTTTFINMRGFTIENGLGHAPTYLAGDLSGMGGGMWVLISSATLKDVVFKNNRAVGGNANSGDGGGAYGSALRIESAPAGKISSLERVSFNNNQSIGGVGPDRGGIAFGALFVFESNVIVEDATFTNNLAQAGNSSGSGTSRKDGLQADALGGGIAVENGWITLKRIKVTGNQVLGGNASLKGGGAYGAGIFVEGVAPYVSSLIIEDSYVANNTAVAGNALTGGHAGGGGILATHSSVAIDRVEAISNSVTGGSSTGGGNAGPGAGGGIYLFSMQAGVPTASIKNTIAADNYVAQGNGIQTLGNGGGGGVVIQGMNADITSVTIAKNRLGSGLILGQGLSVGTWPLPSGMVPATVNLSHSIIADHTEGGNLATAVVSQVGTTLTYDHGLFAGNTKDTNIDNSPVSIGAVTGLNTVVSASSAGFISPGSPNYNYHLRLDSAARDQGTTSSTYNDIDSQDRPNNGLPDLGADEYWPFSLSVVPGDGTLRLDWSVGGALMAGGVNNYEVQITCVDGGTPPDQGNCGQTINVGSATQFTFTGLSNFSEYALTVYARDLSQKLIATSTTINSFTTDIFVYLPLVIK